MSSGDAPSTLQFSNLTFEDFAGTSLSDESKPSPPFHPIRSSHSPLIVVDIECSAAVPCPNIAFKNINVTPPSGGTSEYIFKNVVNETGLPSS